MWRSSMPLTISLSDDVLKQAGMSADEARIEIACRLFDAGKLDLWPAAQLAELSRTQFEGELMKRKIPLYRLTLEDLVAEQKALDDLGI
jgi:predicted HTH domain antitoxin